MKRNTLRGLAIVIAVCYPSTMALTGNPWLTLDTFFIWGIAAVAFWSARFKKE
jgi:hypothetical protein